MALLFLIIFLIKDIKHFLAWKFVTQRCFVLVMVKIDEISFSLENEDKNVQSNALDLTTRLLISAIVAGHIFIKKVNLSIQLPCLKSYCENFSLTKFELDICLNHR